MTIPDSTTPTKTCTGPCGRTLPVTSEYFHQQTTGEYGFNARCKDCVNNANRIRYENSEHTPATEKQREQDRIYYANHKEQRRETARRYYANHRRERANYFVSPENKERRRRQSHNRRALKKANGRLSVLGAANQLTMIGTTITGYPYLKVGGMRLAIFE